MADISSILKTRLTAEGAALVGFGDICSITPDNNHSACVAVAVAVPRKIIFSLCENTLTPDEYDMYYSLNHKLDALALQGAELLHSYGYDAYAQTTVNIKPNDKFSTAIPHKTLATRSGLGWIGKNGLLVTEKYGSAIRLTSILTNAPLEFDAPCNISKCGACNVCLTACPANALRGTHWTTDVNRSQIINIGACVQFRHSISSTPSTCHNDLCGKCFAHCIYSQNYLRRCE